MVSHQTIAARNPSHARGLEDELALTLAEDTLTQRRILPDGNKGPEHIWRGLRNHMHCGGQSTPGNP